VIVLLHGARQSLLKNVHLFATTNIGAARYQDSVTRLRVCTWSDLRQQHTEQIARVACLPVIAVGIGCIAHSTKLVLQTSQRLHIKMMDCSFTARGWELLCDVRHLITSPLPMNDAHASHF
jgi:hypothetical protein